MKQDLAPFDDVRVRHALQMAIDLEEVNDSYFSGFGEWQPWGLAGPAWALWRLQPVRYLARGDQAVLGLRP